MAFEVEDKSSQEKLLKFQIPRAEVLKSIEDSIQHEEAKSRAKWVGPEQELRAEIEKKRGEQIRESVKQAMMDGAYEAAIKEKEIFPASKPSFQNVVFDPEKEPALTFEAPVKLWPAYEVKDIGPCKKHIKVSICPEKIAASVEESLGDIQKNAAIRGFRRGHAPVRLVERQFGREIRSELKQRLIAEAFEMVFKKEGVSPIGEPDIKVLGEEAEKEGEKKEAEKEDDVRLEDHPIEFEVTVEIEPTFEVEGYRGIKLQKKSSEPTEQDVDAALENLRVRASELEKVEGASKEGDVVVCDYKVTVGEEVVADAKGAQLAATGSNIVGIPPKEAAKLLLGAKAGEEKGGKFTLTDAFPKPELRNKEANVTFAVKEVQRLKKPDINDEFAKGLGYESLQQLREDLKKRVQAGKEQSVQRDLEGQITEQLLSKFKFDLPEELVKRQATVNAQRQQLMLLSRGVPREDVIKETQAIHTASQSAAERDFRVYFILEKIAEKERIFATENEVNERISALAMMRGISPGKMQQHLERDGSLSTLRRQIREEKTFAFLIEKAEVAAAKEDTAEAKGKAGT